MPICVVRLFVRLQDCAARRRIPLLPHILQLVASGSCKPRASLVQPSVSPAAADPVKSNQLDRAPIPAVCNFYTIVKRILVIHNTVYNTRAKLISSTCQSPSSLQPALQSPCCKLINWQLARVYASLLQIKLV
jgi:hypothetical protein